MHLKSAPFSVLLYALILKYKFISDGNWTADIKAPDTIDDGFGGLNGLVDVDALAGGGAQAAGPKIKFMTWTMLGAQTKFLINEDKANELTPGLESAGVNMKGYVKFTGEVLPKVPVYVELAIAEQDTFNNLYKQGELDFVTGLTNMGVDLIADPVAWFDGEVAEKTYLGHFVWGFNSDYINWKTGYKYAKLPPHQINDWVTVDKEWEAGYKALGGYNYFELGPKLQKLPFGTITAAVAPNKTADRAGTQYGLFSWINLNCGPVANIDFQYNGAYGKTFKTIFGHVYEHDFIAGFKGIYGPVSVKANVLYNIYGDGDLVVMDNHIYESSYAPAASDVGNTDSSLSGLSNMAANVQANWQNDTVSVTAGFRMRGVQAGMMYVEEGYDEHTNISDQLGGLNRYRGWIDVNGNVTTALNLGIKPFIEGTLDKTKTSSFKSADTLKIKAKPYFTLDMDELAYIPGKLDGYAELAYYTNEADKKGGVFGQSQFELNNIGIHYNQTFSSFIKEMDLTYGFDNRDENYLFNTLISSFKLAGEYTVQAGLGLRTLNKDGKEQNYSMFGAYLGFAKKIPVMAKPTAYAQFMYGMDPYAKFGDGPTGYRMDPDSPYVTKDGVSDYANNYAIRIGLQWDL